MKPLPAPNVAGKTESDRFDNAVRHVLTVSKEELLENPDQTERFPIFPTHSQPQEIHSRIVTSDLAPTF